MRWPKGPPHLALNPPYLFFLFLSLFLIETLFSPLKRAFFVYFQCFSLFSLLLLSFFLPSCLSFLLSLCFLFLSFFHFSFFFCFMQRKHEHIKLQLLCFINLFFFGFLSFLFEIPFSYFSDFKLCSSFNIIVFGFKQTQVEKHQFLVKRGVATKRCF